MDSEKKLKHDDVEIVARAVFYDPETGEIVGSHTFGATGQLSEAANKRFESILHAQVQSLEKRHGRKFAVHRSTEANQLKSLHHRVDTSAGRLVELSQGPGRIKVE